MTRFTLIALGLAPLTCAWVPSVSQRAFATLGSRTLSLASAASLSQVELKKLVGYKAVDDYVRSGMKVGLGTGSTAAFAVERLGMLLKSGELENVVAVPTSVRTKEQAESLGIPLVTLDEESELDGSLMLYLAN
jgi:ribose 5-phosphate isomerase A